MIKLLADENIPKKTVQTLKQRDIDISSVLDSSPGLRDRAQQAYIYGTSAECYIDKPIKILTK